MISNWPKYHWPDYIRYWPWCSSLNFLNWATHATSFNWQLFAVKSAGGKCQVNDCQDCPDCQMTTDISLGTPTDWHPVLGKKKWDKRNDEWDRNLLAKNELSIVRYTSSFTLYHCELLCSCVGRDNKIEGTRVSGDVRNKHCVCSDMLHWFVWLALTCLSCVSCFWLHLVSP